MHKVILFSSLLLMPASAAIADEATGVQNVDDRIAIIEGLAGPEAVHWDAEQQAWFVSNFNGDAAGGNMDGIEPWQGGLLIASQADQAIWFVRDGEAEILIHTPGRPADIGLDAAGRRLAVPYTEHYARFIHAKRRSTLRTTDQAVPAQEIAASSVTS